MLPGIDIALLAPAAAGAASGLSVSVSPTEASKTQGTTSGAKTVTSPTVTAEAAGGTGPYSYAWARHAGSEAITAATPTAASTTFSASMQPDTVLEAIFRMTVTDAAGSTATVDVPVYLHLVDFSSTL